MMVTRPSVVVKPVMSSSGKGQSVVDGPDGLDQAWGAAMAGARGTSPRVIVEEFLRFDLEITLLTIRQHNGEIAGGARATSSGRPWRCVALVRNLPSWSDALKLEWRLKRQRQRHRRSVPRCRCQALCCALGMERWTRSATPMDALRCRLEVLWRTGDAGAEAAAARLVAELPEVAQRLVVRPEE